MEKKDFCLLLKVYDCSLQPVFLKNLLLGTEPLFFSLQNSSYFSFLINAVGTDTPSLKPVIKKQGC